MSAYELNDLMMSWFTLMGQDSNMYLALVSGYLIVAYLIGEKLSRVQVVIINTLFVVWTAMHVSSLAGEIRAVGRIQDKLVELGVYAIQSPQETESVAWSFVIIQIVGILAALYFMQNVRHTKTE